MSEYVQFTGAMVLFVSVLAGVYFFVSTSPGARELVARLGGSAGMAEDAVRDGER